MRIALLGSWRESDREEMHLVDQAEFKGAAETVGRAIIRLGHSLIVGSDREESADYHGTVAAVDFLGKNEPRANEPRARIHLIAPRGQAPLFPQLRRTSPELFAEDSIPADHWAPAKVFQVKEAHGVVVMGGAQATRQAGLTAAVSGRRLVCIGSFGGAAKALNDLFMQSKDSWGNSLPGADDMGVLQNPWSNVLCDKVCALLHIDKPRILIIHGRSDDRLELKNYLQNSLQLPEPVIMAERISPGEPLPTKFEELASEVDGAIALGTPDDIGGLAQAAKSRKIKEARARQNVWLEVGWFWGRLGRRRVLILTRGPIAIPSDLHGLEIYDYQSMPSDRSKEIEEFVKKVAQGTS